MAAPTEGMAPGDLEPIYILVSDEPLLLSRAVGAIREAAVPEALRGFNVDSMTGKGVSGEGVLAAAQTLPMMAERRLLVLDGIDAMAAAELTKLAAYLEAPNPTTVLVATCSKMDGRIKFFQRAKKLGRVHELKPPKNVDSWLLAEAEAAKVSIDRQAALRLVEVVGSDLSRLRLSLEQLSLYAGDRKIGVDDVDDLVATTRERSVFELTDAIAARKVERALAAVAGLFDQRQSAIGVVMMLARHMRQLGLCKEAMMARVPRAELAKRVGAPPFAVQRLADQAESYSIRAVAEAMRRIGEVDRQLKGLGPSTKVLGRSLAERIVVEGLVTDLIELGQGPR